MLLGDQLNMLMGGGYIRPELLQFASMLQPSFGRHLPMPNGPGNYHIAPGDERMNQSQGIPAPHLNDPYMQMFPEQLPEPKWPVNPCDRQMLISSLFGQRFG